MTQSIGDVVDGKIHQIQFDPEAAARAAAALQQKAPEVKELSSPTKIEARIQVVNVGPEVGPNKPCPCGSGKKNKKCCRLRRQTRDIVHRKVVVLDADVAKALKAAKRQGKTVRLK